MSSPDQTTVEILARAAGLERAWAEFREDVMAAASEAAKQRLAADEMEPGEEPWPPMYVKDFR